MLTTWSGDTDTPTGNTWPQPPGVHSVPPLRVLSLILGIRNCPILLRTHTTGPLRELVSPGSTGRNKDRAEAVCFVFVTFYWHRFHLFTGELSLYLTQRPLVRRTLARAPGRPRAGAEGWDKACRERLRGWREDTRTDGRALSGPHLEQGRMI